MTATEEVQVRDPRHTCHFSPVCDQRPFRYNGGDNDPFDCGHDSCADVLYEQCIACFEDARNDTSPPSEYCEEGCGWQEVTEMGGGAGMGGMGSVNWCDLKCGHQNFEEYL